MPTITELPRPGSPEQREICDAVVMRVLALPVDQRVDACVRVLAVYRAMLDEWHAGSDPALLDQSAANFAGALKRRFMSLCLNADGRVGSA